MPLNVVLVYVRLTVVAVNSWVARENAEIFICALDDGITTLATAFLLASVRTKI